MTISTGIGGGIILNGSILRGKTGNAGEFGHMIVAPNGPKCGCGSNGCLEAMCSGTGIIRRFMEKINQGYKSSLITKTSKIEQITTLQIAQGAAEGDILAADIWEETCFYLSIGLGNIITFFDPQAIIIGGGVANRGEQLFHPLRQFIKNQVKIFPIDEISILPAEFGSESVLYGAIALVNSGLGKH
jgi:glucokinase